MKMDFLGQVVIVTGGAGAIGLAISREFAQNGAQVVIADINAPALQQAVHSLRSENCHVDGVVTNVSSAESVENMVREVIRLYGRIDCLVNNAGINGGPEERKPLHEYSDELWDRILSIDLTGVYRCSKSVIPEMLRQGHGNIINIASITGLTPLRLQCAFVAAKAGVINLTKAMALELAEHHIRVNAIAPGSILFEGTRKLFYEDPVRAESMLSHIPQHRAGTPEDIAGMTCFLASDKASYMTGSVITIDGGWTCGFTRDF